MFYIPLEMQGDIIANEFIQKLEQIFRLANFRQQFLIKFAPFFEVF